MAKRDKAVILVLTVGITVGIIGIGIWLLQEMTSLLIPISSNSLATKNDNQNREVQTNRQLKLLGDTFSGYSTFRDRDFQETLKKVGISLSYQNEFNQSKRAEQLNQNNADLYVTTLDQFLKQKPQGKIVGLLDRTIGADAVVLNTQKYPNLKSLLDLNTLVQQKRTQNKTLSITYAEDTPSEYLALVLSTKFEAFKLSNFDKKAVADASVAWKLLQDRNQNIAVAVLWEPYVTQAKKQGYTVILSSLDAPTAIVDVIVASNRLIESQPQVISEFLEAYYRRIDINVRDPYQLKEQIAKDSNLSDAEATTVLSGIDFFTSVEAKKWMSDRTLEKRIGATAAVLVLAGKIEQIPQNFQDLYTAQFLEQAATNTETLISLIRADNQELAARLSGQGVTISTPEMANRQIETAPDIGNLQVTGEVTFNSESAILTPTSQQTLDRITKEIQEFNPQTIAVRIIGHTSQRGDKLYNQQLSEQRAKVVADALKQRGLTHNIIAEGKGSSSPLPNISPTDSRQQRTEIRLVRIDS